LQITVPCSRFVLGQFDFGQSLGQIAASANFLIVRHEAREWFAVLQQHERDILVVGTVHAVGKTASGFGDRYASFFPKI